MCHTYIKATDIVCTMIFELLVHFDNAAIQKSKDIVSECNAAEEFMNLLLRWRFRICKCYLSGLGITSVHMNSKAAGLQKTACYCIF